MTEPSAQAPPRWLAIVAWGTGAVALYALLLGRVTLDALDAEFPQRGELRQQASTGHQLEIEVGLDGQDSAEARDALSLLPELFVLLAEREKLRILITDHESLDGENSDHIAYVAGTYDEHEQTILIAHDAPRPGHTALHEVGHFVDATLDGCSRSDAFTRVYEAAVAEGHMAKYHQSDPAEAFAHMFAEHFFSDRRRARLAENDPEAAAFFQQLTSMAACPGIEVPN